MPRDILRQNATLAGDFLPKGLSTAQGLALAALLVGKPITTAAREAGVSRSTVHRWLNDDPEFLATFNGARAEMAAAVEQGLRLLSASAVTTLRVLLTRRRVSDEVKLRAALAVLDRVAAPVQGPTDVDDAKSEIAIREKRRAVRRSMGGRSDEEAKARLHAHLDRPIDDDDLDALAEIDDDDLDDEDLDDE